jgi:hypothetical protein
MSQNEDWFQGIQQSLAGLKTTLGKDGTRKYRLDRLEKLAGRLACFDSCRDCQQLRLEVEQLIATLQQGKPDKQQQRDYLGRLDHIVSHLHKTHNLVTEGQNLAAWLCIGTLVGMVLGSVTGTPVIGISIGISLGIATGTLLDAQARRQGRVI